MPIKKTRAEAGFSIMEVIVCTGLLGIAAYVAQSQMLLTFKYNAQTESRQDLMAVGHDIQRRVDCDELPATCSVGTFLELKDKKTGEGFIKSDRSSSIRGWNVAVECGTDNTILVRGAKPNPKGGFFKEPLTGLDLSWNNPNNVIFPAGALCSAELTPIAGPVNLDVGMVSGSPCVVMTTSELPCPAPQPPSCNIGYVSSGLSLDTFGGENSSVGNEVYGQRWTRYCVEKAPE